MELSREHKVTVLLSSHHLHQVQQVCDRVGLFVSGRLLATGDIKSLASQLFARDPFTIEIGIEKSATEPGDNTGEQDSINAVIHTLEQIDGVNSIRRDAGLLLAECSRDLTAEIAGAVIKTGVGLTSLNSREYGLDDIYYRYFEGGTDHE